MTKLTMTFTSDQKEEYIRGNFTIFKDIAKGLVKFSTLSLEQRKNICLSIFNSPIYERKGKVSIYDASCSKYYKEDQIEDFLPESIEDILKELELKPNKQIAV